MFQTKLLFNEAFPASARNRASHVRMPAPIVIERLRPLPPPEDRVKSPGSSISFTALSEERLQVAVKLAKRDMRHRRLKLLTESPDRAPQETSTLHAGAVEFRVPDEVPVTSPFKMKLKTSSPKSKSGTKLSALTIRNNSKFNGHSLPPKDLGPRQGKTSLSWHLIKLQNELKVFVQKVEELASKAGEIVEESLEPDEEKKLELRREKQAARSSRNIYVLQQQVKKIEQDMEMFTYQKTWDTKKSIAVNRLAAAHRGTLRALQVVIHQLSDTTGGKLPPSYKELGQLIRQLSLCSAKVEAENGSVLPDPVLSILQKLETLDSAYSKQILEKQLQAHACSPRPKSSQPSLSPTRAPKGPSVSSLQQLQKPAQVKRAVHARRIKTTREQKVALPRFVQQRALRPQSVAAHRKGVAVRILESRSDVLTKNRDAGFQQPTVSSQLRVNQVPQKEHYVPWVPASPHSSPPRTLTQRCQPEPRCLFSTAKLLTNSPKQHAAGCLAEEPLALSSETKKQAQKEALRKAWQNKMTMMRLKGLNQLTKEETHHIQSLRSQAISHTDLAERAEWRSGERTPPHVGKQQLMADSQNAFGSPPRDRLQTEPAVEFIYAVGGSACQNETLLENILADAAEQVPVLPSNFKLEDKTDHRLQTLTLERMLRHMEEIQRDQEEVRKRNASICYSDPLYWERAEAAGPRGHDLGCGPASPQPIRLTRPALKQTSAADIVLENPVETGLVSDNSLAAEEEDEKGVASPVARQTRPTFPDPAEPGRGAPISVTSGMLGNIRQYRAAYDSYLRDVSREVVGSLDPWAVADSLADELLSDALAEVAAEFQDVVEEYAEAVFTSEFLQPIHSPPALTATLTSQ